MKTQHLSKWFLGGMSEKSVFNVRILLPPSNRQASFSATYKKHEKKKEHIYTACNAEGSRC